MYPTWWPAATGVKRMVDAFVVPEMNNAVMRLSSLGGALLLQSKGLETVMQVCCRDRNRLALQGDLLAAHALGVPNVMAVTGDEITHGDHHQAKAVNDLGLLELLSAPLGRCRPAGIWPGWTSKGAPQFLVGSTVKVTGDAERPEAGTGGPGPENCRRGPVFYHPGGFRRGRPGEIPATGGPAARPPLFPR